MLFISILTLIILGNISRKGYLSELQLNESLSTQGNYSYNFRIKYYSKLFRNSDIYGVYIDTNKVIQDNSFLKEIKFDYKGSPFGILTSTKELNTNDKIDNINYKLKIKLLTLILFLILILFIYIVIYSIIRNKIYLLFSSILKNRIKLLLEFINKIKCFYLKYKKHIFIFYSIITLVFLLFIIINSNIKHNSKLVDLELIAESRAGYVYKAKIAKYNKLFSVDNNSIQFDNTNDIKYYGYSLEITNKPLGSWHSTNIYYTDNNTFIISNESANENAYYYNIKVPTYIGDKYKITILAKKIPNDGMIKWHLNGNNNFKEIIKKEISNDYIILTDTREIYNIAGGVLDLHLIFPQGVTEIESILIESLNKSLNTENAYTVFNTDKKIDTLKIQYNIKLSNISKYIIVILVAICLLILYITYRDYIKLKYIKLFLYGVKFQRLRKYIFICYSIFVIIFILFIIINSSIKITSKLIDLELIAESRVGYVYKAKIENYKDSKLFSIDNNSIQINNTNDIKYYGYSLFITNKPLGSWHSTNIYYTDNNTFIISNESTEENAYYYNIQVPTYIGDKYKINILSKQLPEKVNISWHLNGNNNFKEINKKEISNDYIVLIDTREVINSADDNLDLYLVIPQGVTEIESILIESLNINLHSENGYTIFTSEKKIDNSIYYLEYFVVFKILYFLLLILSLSIVIISLCKINNIFKYFNHIIYILVFIFLALFIFLLIFININLYLKYLYLSIYLVIFYSLLGSFIVFKLQLHFNLKNIIYILMFNTLYSILLNYNYVNSNYNVSKFSIFFIISFILATFFFIFYLYAEYKQMKIEKIFLISTLVIGIGYIILLPPMMVPDETRHYFRSYEISKGFIMLQYNNNGNRGNYLPIELRDIGKPISSYSEIKNKFNIKINDNGEKVLFTPPAYSPFSYFPQSIGMLLARLINIQSYGEIYIAKLFALLFFVISIYFSIKHIPVKKITLYFICFFPMVLHQVASLSADSVLITSSFAFLSYVLYLKYSKESIISIKESIILFLLFLLVAMSKSFYVFLFLTVFSIPKEKFKYNKYLVIFIILFTIGIIYLLWSINISKAISNIKNINLNKNYILTNPIGYLGIFINTIIIKTNFYISSLIGRYLVWLNLTISNFAYYSILILFLLLIITDYDEKIKVDLKIISFIIIGIIYTLVLTALYLAWTPIDFNYIEGVQGRYFLPIVFLVFLILNFNYLKYVKLKISLNDKILFLVLSMLNINVLNTIFNRFFI